METSMRLKSKDMPALVTAVTLTNACSVTVILNLNENSQLLLCIWKCDERVRLVFDIFVFGMLLLVYMVSQNLLQAKAHSKWVWIPSIFLLAILMNLQMRT